MRDTSTLYLKIHVKTGYKYLGVTINDPYLYKGSGVEWTKHLKEHGSSKNDIETIILFQDTLTRGMTSVKFQEKSKEMSRAYDVVNNENFANLVHETGVIGAIDSQYHDVYEKYEMVEFDDTIGSEQYEATQYTFTNNLVETTSRVLLSLTEREERVIRMRFGIGPNTDHTLEEVAEQLNVSRERLRQIEAKALRKMKHPSRSRKLRSFLDDGNTDIAKNENTQYCVYGI